MLLEANESSSSIEKELLSSTSDEVCEKWDGENVVRIEAKEPFIQELIYLQGNWYDLGKALKSEVILPIREAVKGPERKWYDLTSALKVEKLFTRPEAVKDPENPPPKDPPLMNPSPQASVPSGSAPSGSTP